jgi:hypothetical protein
VRAFNFGVVINKNTRYGEIIVAQSWRKTSYSTPHEYFI